VLSVQGSAGALITNGRLFSPVLVGMDSSGFDSALCGL
jgi:hypothetical protein